MANLESTKQALMQQEPTKSLRTMIEEASKELGRALPQHLRAERLVRIALTNIRTVPELAKCSPESFLGALFTAAQLGVEPVAGRAYILPFNNSRKKPDGTWHTVKEAQFVMGYRGLVELFYRHEKSLMLNWGVVKAKDEFSYELGTEAFLKHIPASGDRGETIGFYVIADLGKAKPFHYMSLAECLEHGKKHSKTYDKKAEKFFDNSPWQTSREAMCLKTVLNQLCKVLPLSFELQQAIEQDESSREYHHGLGNVLEVPSSTNWDESKQTEPEPEPPEENSSKPMISNKTGKAIEFGE